MVLKDASGAVIDVEVAKGEAAFNAAMAAPEKGQGPTEQTAPAPPVVDPEAPYGRTKDGKPKRGPGGRPAKDADKPRVQAASAAPSDARDFTPELGELARGVWWVLAALPPTQAQAAVWNEHAPNMVGAWALAARQNTTVRAGVEWLTGSGATWTLAVGMATVPLVLQSVELWRDPNSETAQHLRARTVATLEEAKATQMAAMAAAA